MAIDDSRQVFAVRQQYLLTLANCDNAPKINRFGVSLLRLGKGKTLD